MNNTKLQHLLKPKLDPMGSSGKLLNERMIVWTLNHSLKISYAQLSITCQLIFLLCMHFPGSCLKYKKRKCATQSKKSTARHSQSVRRRKITMWPRKRKGHQTSPSNSSSLEGTVELQSLYCLSNVACSLCSVPYWGKTYTKAKTPSFLKFMFDNFINRVSR